MKEIPLTRGKFALVDDEDYERLLKFNWQYNNGYATRYGYIPGTCRSKTIRMAQEVLQTIKLVDHKSRGKLNNQKFNLRICTPTQNAQNRIKAQKKATSQYKGVTFRHNRQKWQATIGLQNLFPESYIKYLGCNFTTEKEAAEAYDEAARYYFGEFARLNFPKGGERSCLCP